MGRRAGSPAAAAALSAALSARLPSGHWPPFWSPALPSKPLLSASREMELCEVTKTQESGVGFPRQQQQHPQDWLSPEDDVSSPSDHVIHPQKLAFCMILFLICGLLMYPLSPIPLIVKSPHGDLLTGF